MKTTLLAILIVAGISAGAQEIQDSIFRPSHILKYDLTSYFLFRKSIAISYERTINHRQSLSVTAGFQELPPIEFLLDSVELKNNTTNSGFKIGAEYRFYLKNENRYAAPRGVYLGPYVSYLRFYNERLATINSGGTQTQSVLTSKINILNLGAQIGYQFIIKDRWSIDLVFIGPSVANYRTEFTTDGTLAYDLDELNQEILDRLIAKFPVIGSLLEGEGVSKNGKISGWNWGYRYQFHIGYKLNKSKK